MDLTYLVAAFDFNITNDIQDNQKDSRSYYHLTFNDAKDVFVQKSLVGDGIATSWIVKQVRGAGVKGMFFGFGDEIAGFYDFGKLRASGEASVGKPVMEVNNNNKELGKVANILFTHADTDQSAKIVGGSISSTYLSEDDSVLSVAVLGDNTVSPVIEIKKDAILPVGSLVELGSLNSRFRNIFTSRTYYQSGVFDTAGAGTPEGNIVASVGSTYRNMSGGTGTTFYVKESGTGNTGWVAK